MKAFLLGLFVSVLSVGVFAQDGVGEAAPTCEGAGSACVAEPVQRSRARRAKARRARAQQAEVARAKAAVVSGGGAVAYGRPVKSPRTPSVESVSRGEAQVRQCTPPTPEGLRKHVEELEALAKTIRASGQPEARAQRMERRATALRARADELAGAAD